MINNACIIYFNIKEHERLRRRFCTCNTSSVRIKYGEEYPYVRNERRNNQINNRKSLKEYSTTIDFQDFKKNSSSSSSSSFSSSSNTSIKKIFSTTTLAVQTDPLISCSASTQTDSFDDYPGNFSYERQFEKYEIPSLNTMSIFKASQNPQYINWLQKSQVSKYIGVKELATVTKQEENLLHLLAAANEKENNVLHKFLYVLLEIIKSHPYFVWHENRSGQTPSDIAFSKNNVQIFQWIQESGGHFRINEIINTGDKKLDMLRIILKDVKYLPEQILIQAIKAHMEFKNCGKTILFLFSEFQLNLQFIDQTIGKSLLELLLETADLMLIENVFLSLNHKICKEILRLKMNSLLKFVQKQRLFSKTELENLQKIFNYILNQNSKNT
ncbi:DgyrCDS7822 [Dimorphilus gyrociliatus]|uniref:DgyrCDS7822 n=1 Tax=Dimorphilus gyrociliatus TaxID=2664684 RepID=A0A7I8VX59_9ANNE|nr:DgyrCDS7822 [Dimorphilus gyrociliatus]